MESTKIREWLHKTGFPLEMRAASCFQKAGFEVRQSYHYHDPNKGVGREIDVMANLSSEYGQINIVFLLECKSGNFPWMVLCSDFAFDNYNRIDLLAVTSQRAREYMLKNFASTFKEFCTSGGRGGYGFRQAMGGKEDQAYGATIGLMNAAQAIRYELRGRANDHLTVIIPVLVVDTPLFECSLSDDNDIDVVEVDRSCFLFNSYLPSRVGCMVRVVTLDALERFSESSAQLAKKICDGLVPAEDHSFGE